MKRIETYDVPVDGEWHDIPFGEVIAIAGTREVATLWILHHHKEMTIFGRTAPRTVRVFTDQESVALPDEDMIHLKTYWPQHQARYARHVFELVSFP